MAADTRVTFAPGHEDIPALAERIVHEVAMALVPHTPGDDHTEPASRVAAIAALRVLAADQRSRFTPQRRTHLYALIEEINRSAPSSSVDEGNPDR